jgi:cell division protein FtsW
MSLATKLSAELQGDRIIWGVMGMLGLCSLLAVYSTSINLYYQSTRSTERYLFEQFVMLLMGMGLTFVLHRVHYMHFSKWAPMLLVGVAIPLLAFTMLFGSEVNEARRWIRIPGVGISFQPSDMAKLVLILYVARKLTAKQDVIKDLQQAFMPILVPVVLVCGLIAPSNLSSALILFTVCLMMMFIGRVNIKYIVLLVVMGLLMFALLILIGEEFPDFIRSRTWVSRLQTFLTGQGDRYQVENSLMAIAHGGLFGNGPGNSYHRNFVPYAYADYIYTVILEEYGLIGGLFVMFLYLTLMFRIVRLVGKSPKTFGALAAVGIGILIVFQALTNMAVSVNMLPVTGQTLPLISKGGSSILFTCAALGVVLSISRYIEKVT